MIFAGQLHLVPHRSRRQTIIAFHFRWMDCLALQLFLSKPMVETHVRYIINEAFINTVDAFS